MIDTHAHLYLEHFSQDLNEVISRIKNQEIDRIYLPNVDVTTIVPLNDLVNKDQNLFFPMMGLHPCSVNKDWENQLKTIYKELKTNAYCGVGEIGIDLYWDKTYAQEQELVYRTQINWAIELNLPIVIHSRESLDQTIGVVQEMQNGKLRGIFHCFNGSIDQANRIMDLGFYLGIGGVITYKNAGVDKVVSQLPLESMVLETDAPYLSPVPFRGKRNEPSYLIYIAEKIAAIKEMTLEEVKRITAANAIKIFHGADTH